VGLLDSYKKDASQDKTTRGQAIEDDGEIKRRVNSAGAARGDRPQGKAGAYVLLACFFFIAYWVSGRAGSTCAGGQGRKHLSWAAFALSALLATALTVGVVKLVLRGDPEAKHFTIVRRRPGEDAVAVEPDRALHPARRPATCRCRASRASGQHAARAGDHPVT
jgi:hypothetical protein